MTTKEQITQLTADLAECRKWLKETNLKFDDSDFRVSELLKQNKLLAAEIETWKHSWRLAISRCGTNFHHVPEVVRALDWITIAMEKILSTPNPGAEILDELKRDSERLDWLKQRINYVGWNADMSYDEFSFTRKEIDEAIKHDTTAREGKK